MHAHTPYVRAYRARQKQRLLDLQTELDRVKAENTVLRHNLDVRERETERSWRQIAQLDAALCKTLGRQWKHEDIPEEAASSTVWQLARSIWTDQLKPIPGEDPSSS
jgi:septal ring factor EnvC (AmiA/AmiB activator)